MNPQILQAAKDIVLRETGLFFSPEKDYFFVSKLQKRLRLSGARSEAEYLYMLRNKAEEFQELVNLLTVSETYFMREFPYLELAAKTLVPQLAQNNNPVRVLSAGCATGEELYSLLMLLSHYNFPERKIMAWGLDINTRSLDVARGGIYGEMSLRHMGPGARKILEGFAEPQENGKIRLRESLIKRARFVKANLFKGLAGLGPFDLVLLRNTLIYIAKDMRVRVLENLRAAMRPGAHLIMGQVEIAGGTFGLFSEKKAGGLVVFVKEERT